MKPVPRELRDSWETFARLGRWGTCVYCPAVEGRGFPELCSHTERYDHQLGLDELLSAYRRYTA